MLVMNFRLGIIQFVVIAIGCNSLKCVLTQTISKPKILSLFCDNVTVEVRAESTFAPYSFAWVIDNGTMQNIVASVHVATNGNVTNSLNNERLSRPIVIVNRRAAQTPPPVPILSSLFFPFKENDYQEFAFVIQTYKGPFIRSDAIMKPTCPTRPNIMCHNSTCLCNHRVSMRCSNPMVRPRGICKEDGTYEFINECPPERSVANALITSSVFLVVLLLVLCSCKILRPFEKTEGSSVKLRKEKTRRKEVKPIKKREGSQQMKRVEKKIIPELPESPSGVYFTLPATQGKYDSKKKDDHKKKEAKVQEGGFLTNTLRPITMFIQKTDQSYMAYTNERIYF